MTGRNLCDQCNGMGYTGSEEDNNKEVCDECGGEGIDWR
jgi:DnaJ-class molecular chaperone